MSSIPPSDQPPVERQASPIAPPQINSAPAVGPYAAPPQYAGYYRPGQLMGSPEKLEALAAGYFALNWVFCFQVGLVLVSMIGLGVIASSNPNSDVLIGVFYLFFFPITIGLVAWVAYKPLKKISFGMNWASNTAIWLGIGVGFGGLIVYIIIQMLAAAEIGKYGVKRSFFGGFRKKQIAEAAQAMRASPMYQATAPPM